jgi:hypothetical protein
MSISHAEARRLLCERLILACEEGMKAEFQDVLDLGADVNYCDDKVPRYPQLQTLILNGVT